MKRLLLLLPLVALAACSGKPEATITAPNAPKPKIAPQFNLADEYKQQIVDKAALQKHCNYEFENATYEASEEERFSIKNENGRRPIYNISKGPSGKCYLSFDSFFGETYYGCSYCRIGVTGECPPTHDFAKECYITAEGRDLVVYEKSRNGGGVRRGIKATLIKALSPY